MLHFVLHALLAFNDYVYLNLKPGWVTFGEPELKLLYKLAFGGEKIIRRKTFGIDNTVSTYGM